MCQLTSFYLSWLLERRYKLHFLGADYKDIRETNQMQISTDYAENMVTSETTTTTIQALQDTFKIYRLVF
jgi:hypothetical protein